MENVFKLEDEYWGTLIAIVYSYASDFDSMTVTGYYNQKGAMVWVTGLNLVTSPSEVLNFCQENQVQLIPERMMDIAG